MPTVAQRHSGVEFSKNGYLMLEGVVPDEINRRTLEYVDANPSMRPNEILLEEWFDQNVMKNAEAAGAVRSLLGRDFALPNRISNHRVECPLPAQEWHFDGGSKYGPELNYLQVFYYPQDCPLELGPTELDPVWSADVVGFVVGPRIVDRVGGKPCDVLHVDGLKDDLALADHRDEERVSCYLSSKLDSLVKTRFEEVPAI